MGPVGEHFGMLDSGQSTAGRPAAWRNQAPNVKDEAFPKSHPCLCQNPLQAAVDVTGRGVHSRRNGGSASAKC